MFGDIVLHSRDPFCKLYNFVIHFYFYISDVVTTPSNTAVPAVTGLAIGQFFFYYEWTWLTISTDANKDRRKPLLIAKRTDNRKYTPFCKRIIRYRDI